MKNPTIALVAKALGFKVSSARLDAIHEVSVARMLPAALSASTLPAQMRAAIIAVPPLTTDQIPERIAQAQAIADRCAAAAASTKNPIFNILAPGFAMAGAQPDQVSRELVSIIANLSEQVTVDTTQMPGARDGSSAWDQTVERLTANQKRAAAGGSMPGVHGD